MCLHIPVYPLSPSPPPPFFFWVSLFGSWFIILGNPFFSGPGGLLGLVARSFLIQVPAFVYRFYAVLSFLTIGPGQEESRLKPATDLLITPPSPLSSLPPFRGHLSPPYSLLSASFPRPSQPSLVFARLSQLPLILLVSFPP